MGIHGLTTYLRQNRTLLSDTLLLSSHDSHQRSGQVRIVVDGWSFIYELVLNAPPLGIAITGDWVYGGEHDALYELIQRVVEVWLDMGIELHFVFDGPYPAIKHETLIKRTTQSVIQHSLLFFRTSPAARATLRFLRAPDTAISPPLTYTVCVSALRDLIRRRERDGQEGKNHSHQASLTIHHAPAEADPYAVALAAHLGAYVLGLDSDYVVLNQEGYLGYVPLDFVVWTEEVEDEGEVGTPTTESSEWDGGEDGFKTVGRKGRGIKRVRAVPKTGVRSATGLAPPSVVHPPNPSPTKYSDGGDGQEQVGPGQTKLKTTLSLTVYSPSVLADHLALPPSLLPLVGAFLGNDYTSISAASTSSQVNEPSDFARLFFEKGLSPAERVERVAKGVRSVLEAALPSPSAPAKTRKKGRTIGSVMDLIEASVEELLVRPLDTIPGGVSFLGGSSTATAAERVVERIVDATLPYAVPPYSELVSLASSPPASASSSLSDRTRVPNPIPVPYMPQIPTHLHAPYAASLIHPRLLDPFISRTSWPRPGLEDPDKETVGRWVGESLRVWCWALTGVGRMKEEGEETDAESEDTEEEVGGLEVLKGRLRELEGVDEDSEDEDEEVPVVEHDESDSGEDTSRYEDGSREGTRMPQEMTVLEYTRRSTRLAPSAITIPSLASLLASLEPPLIPPPRPSPPSRPRNGSWVRSNSNGALKGKSVHSDGGSERSGRESDLLEESEWEWEDAPHRWPLPARITLFLRILKSDVPSVRALISSLSSPRLDDTPADVDAELVAREKVGTVLVLRWIVTRLAERAREAGAGREREKERWTKDEARAFLRAFRWSSAPSPAASAAEPIPIVDRSIQLSAQVSSAVDTIDHLAQALFLADVFPSPVRALSGRRFHALLAGLPSEEGEIEDALWRASEEGLDGAYREPVAKKSKREKREERKAEASAGQGKAMGKPTGRGMFGMLAELGDA